MLLISPLYVCLPQGGLDERQTLPRGSVCAALLSLTGALSLLVPSFGMQRLTYAQSHAPVGTPPPLSTNFGGPVMAGKVNVYAIFWFPGDQGDYSTYISAIKQ